MTSAIITTLPCKWRRWNQRYSRQGVPSGRNRLGSAFLFLEEGHRLKPVVAGKTVPEISGAVRGAFDPFRGGNRLAALGAGIAVGQIAEIQSGHDGLPSCCLLLALLLANWTG